MFDLADFEDNLKRNLDLFAGGPLLFHEPVWGVEHSAPRGSTAWEEGMYHLRLTAKYAKILRPAAMVCHLNNGPVPPEEKGRMLRTSLENLAELREMFPGVTLLVENTGIRSQGTQLLSQEEFTALCREKQFPVVIDTGHANANGWDLEKLIGDLRPQIRAYHLHNNDGARDLHCRLRDGTLDLAGLLSHINRFTPDAMRVIEYTRPDYHGRPLLEDIAWLQLLSPPEKSGGSHGE